MPEPSADGWTGASEALRVRPRDRGDLAARHSYDCRLNEEAAAFLFRAKHIPQARTAVRLAWLEWEQISYTSTLPFTSEIHQ